MMARRLKVAQAAGKVSLAVFISRILGLVRDQVFANFFGAGLFNDAWQVAFRIPNLLRDLFAEGALSAAFVPAFTETFEKKGRVEAWLLANLVMSGLLVLLGGLAILFLIFPELFVRLLALGFAEVPGKVEVTAALLRILAPFLLFIALATVAMGILNSLNHFFLPALAPALFNVMVILAGFFLVPRFEAWGITPIYAMAVGAVIGGMLQFAVQWPLLRRHGFRFRLRFDWGHPGVRRMAFLMGPAVVGVSAVQINVLVNTQLASFLGNGPVSWLAYAFRIIYLPIGLFGVAVGVANLREVSVFAAQERWEELKETVANSLKLVSFLAVPSSLGLIALAFPVVRVLFERGDFTPLDTRQTALALAFYALGLWAYSCVKVYVPTFYALNDTRTPLRISLVSVAANLLVNVTLVLLLPQDLKHVGLAFGTALSVSLSTFLLSRSFRERMGPLRPFGVHRNLVKILLAAVPMGSIVYGAHHALLRLWPQPGGLQEALFLFACMALGVAVYGVLAWLLGVEEVRLVWKRLRG